MNQFDFNKLDKSKMYAAYFVPKNVKIFSAHFAIQLKAKQTVKKFKLKKEAFYYKQKMPSSIGEFLVPIEQDYATHSAMFVWLEAHEYKGKWYESQWWIFESHIQTGVVRYPASEIQTESDIYAYVEDLDLKVMNDLIGTEYGKYDMLGFFNEFIFPFLKKSRWHDVDDKIGGLFCTEYVFKCLVKKLKNIFGEVIPEPVMQQYLANISGKEIIKL